MKLNSDMISYTGSVQCPTVNTQTFGPAPSAGGFPSQYEEGPWIMKHGTTYYLAYAANNIPEDISYSRATAATGPFTYGGTIMKAIGASFTNHTGIIDFNGHSYFFYHDGALQKGGSVPSNGDGYHRSVCLEEFKYNSDGSFPTIAPTTAGPQAIANLNPFVQTEAETIAWESGVQTEVTSDTGGGMDVTSINNGDYIKVRSVDFGAGATSFDARVASSTSGGNIELHLDSVSGTLIGTCAVAGTGGAQTWTTKSCTVTSTTGVHDLFLKFTGSGTGNLFNFNWWRFDGPGASVDRRRRGRRSGDGWQRRERAARRARAERRAERGGAAGGGGAHATGGAGTGGHVGAGGTGGTMVSGSGGSTGGTTGSGGTAATGGTTGTGGATASGGAKGSGGAIATGGVTGGGGSGTSGTGGGGGNSGEGKRQRMQLRDRCPSERRRVGNPDAASGVDLDAERRPKKGGRRRDSAQGPNVCGSRSLCQRPRLRQRCRDLGDHPAVAVRVRRQRRTLGRIESARDIGRGALHGHREARQAHREKRDLVGRLRHRDDVGKLVGESGCRARSWVESGTSAMVTSTVWS